MSVNQNLLQQFQALEQSMSEQLSVMRKTLGLGDVVISASSAKPKKSKKTASAASVASDGSAPRATSAWSSLIADTVADMRQNGWTSWTDINGIVWPASRPGSVKNQSGVEVSAFVYDGGENDGKAPSHAVGGMKRASYLKQQTDPEARAKAEAYQAKLSEKRSANGSVASEGSVGSPDAVAPVADAPKKSGRPKMTEAQKAEAAAKRAADKAAAASASASEPFTDVTVVASTPQKAKKPLIAPKAPAKKVAEKPVDLSFYEWQHEGTSYIKNDRGDVINAEEGCYVGRFDGTVIDESFPEPSDLDGNIAMRE